MHARQVQHQFVLVAAMAGQVDEQQVFGAATLGQGLRRPGKVLAGGQRAVIQMVAVIDQRDLAYRAKAALEQVADIVGFAQKHALLAVAGKGQAVQFDFRRRGRHFGQGLFQQATLIEQGQLQWIR
ncbi:hypothetical protein D3C79_896930 [compost metagenome]